MDNYCFPLRSNLEIIISSERYHLIAVIQLQHHIRRIVGNGLRVSVDFNVVKYESLVPCGVQSGSYDLCGFAHM